MSKPSANLHGFRFSWTDGVVLFIAVLTTWSLKAREIELFWIPPMVVGHFFLFCNVFRVRRNYELIWACLFLLNVGFWMSRLSLRWQEPLLCQVPVTLVVIVAEMRSRRYHGIWASRLNPFIEEYLATKRAQRHS